MLTFGIKLALLHGKQLLQRSISLGVVSDDVTLMLGY
jgi:hypothetical protein